MARSIERGSEKEPQPKNEINIGGGETIRIDSFKETGFEVDGIIRTPKQEKELPLEELEKIKDKIASLPFHIGSKEGVGMYWKKEEGKFLNERPVHDALLRFDRADEMSGYKGPEREDIIFDFYSPDVLTRGIHPESANGLEIRQGETYPSRREKIFVSFSPDKTLRIREKDIRNICLVIPMPTER